MIRRASSLLLLVVALVAAGCGTTSADSGAATPRAQPAAASTGTTAVAALATDQACTRRAAAGSVLASVAFRADDLPAMTLSRSALGAGVAGYETNWLSYGYLDNVELPRLRLGPSRWCAINRDNGRITGFSRGFVGAQHVWSTNHVFFSGSDAAHWLSAYVAGVKALPGSKGVTSVRVTAVPSLGAGAVRIVVRSQSLASTSVFFRRGSVVGEVYDGHAPAARNVVDVTAAAKQLAARVVDRSAAAGARTADREDLVMQLSAGLPKSALGTRYASLAWDWFYGGCWDVVEASTQTAGAAEAKAYRDAAARTGQLTYCRSMYAPSSGGAVNGVERAFTGGTLYAASAGAHDAISRTLADWRRRGAVTRFSVGSLGDETLGLQQKVGTSLLTRAFVRHGRYVAVAAVNGSFGGAITDVRRWAAALDRRVTALLSTRRV